MCFNFFHRLLIFIGMKGIGAIIFDDVLYAKCKYWSNIVL
jgi:hypothetical protein